MIHSFFLYFIAGKNRLFTTQIWHSRFSILNVLFYKNILKLKFLSLLLKTVIDLIFIFVIEKPIYMYTRIILLEINLVQNIWPHIIFFLILI